MGHKVHPTGFRLGIIKDWQSRWYADKNYKEVLAEDFGIRKAINKDLYNAGVSRIEIERVAGSQITVTIYTAKPGVVIGKSGEKVDRLRLAMEKMTNKKVHLKIQEIRTPELDAVLVGRSIAEQLEKRVSFRRAMKQAVQKAMKSGAKGVKIICSGRLGGAEIARVEKEIEGSVPLHTLRADIDFAISEAHTTFGTIGIKVYIYRGLVLSDRRRLTPLGAPGDVSPERGPRPSGDRGDRRDRGPRRDGDRGGRGGPRRDGGGDRGGDRGGRPPFNDRGPRPQGPGGNFSGPRPQGPGGNFSGPRPQGPGGNFSGPRPQGPGGNFSGPRPLGPNGTLGEQPPTPASVDNAPVAPEAHQPVMETPQQTPPPPMPQQTPPVTPQPTPPAPTPDQTTESES